MPKSGPDNPYRLFYEINLYEDKFTEKMLLKSVLLNN
jgi:hypothetical protein